MRLKNFLFACILSMAVTAKADSPITSTYFAVNYYEYPIVIAAETARSLTREVADYLLNEDNPIDVKAAVINAIGWNYEGNGNAQTFKEMIAKSKGATTQQLNLNDLSAHELMCLGYFIAMDNYFIVEEAINILEMSAAKNENSFTINMILTMVKGQQAMDTNFCKVWTLTSDLLNDKSLERDIKTAAIQTVVDYMILYKMDCLY